MKRKLLSLVLLLALCVPWALGQTAIPYTEGFESVSYYSSLTGWTSVGSGSKSIQTYSSYAHNGSHCLYFSYAGGSSGSYTNYAIMPTFSQEIANLELKVWQKPEGTSSGYLDIGYITDVSDASTFVSVKTINYSDNSDYHEETVYFTGAQTGSRIAFRHRPSSSNWYWYIDDITVSTIPTCYPPTSLTSSNITSSGATISWTASGHGETDYQYICQTSTTAAPTESDWSSVQPASGTSCNLTGLNANTSYDIYVRSYCSATDQSSAVKYTFKTPCTAENTPYSENFENMTSNTVPGCWDNSGSTTSTLSGYYPYYVWGVYSYGGNKMLRMYNYSVSSGSALINTPQIVLPSGSPQLSFNYSHTATSGSFYVKISTDNGANFTTIGTYSKNPSASSYDYGQNPGTLTPVVIDLSPYAGETVIIQFYNYANSGYGAIFVDDVSVTVPSCFQPSGLTVTDITSTSANISWTASGHNEQGYEYVIAEGTDAPDWSNANSTTSTYASLTNLQPNNHPYTVYVRSDCGVQGESESISQAFNTACAVISSFPFNDGFENEAVGELGGCYNVTNGSSYYKLNVASDAIYNNTASGSKGITSYYSYGSSNYASSTSYTHTFTRMVHLEEGKYYEISIYAKKYNSSYTDYSWKLSFVNGTTASNTSVIGSTFDVTSTGFQKFSTSLSVNADGDYYVGVKTEKGSYSTYYVYLDDIEIKEVACPTPASLTASNETANSVDLSWTGGSAWNMQYSTDNETWTSVSGTITNPYTLTSLTANTQYYVQVQADCSGTTSAWTSSVSFKTPCNTETITSASPFNEDFNALTSDIPECWDNSDGTTTYESYKWNYYSTGKTGACVRFNSYNNSSGLTNMLKTPILSLPANPATLSFYYKNPAGGDFSVYISTDGGSTYTTSLRTGLTSQSSWTNVDISLSSYAGQDVVIVFKATSNCGYGDAYIYLDDVKVEAPACAKPSGVTVSDIAATQANINITGGSAWNIKYIDTGNTDTNDTVTVNNVTSPYTLTGLSSNTSYQVKVQTNCGTDGNSAWSNEVQFRTTIAIPYSESFNSSSISSLWTQGTGLVDNVIAGTADITSGGSWYICTTSNGLPASHVKGNIWGTNWKSWLISPSVFVNTNDAQLSFDIALTAYGNSSAAATNGTDDRFVVLISTNNGTTWSILREWNNSGSSYVYNNVATNGESVVIPLMNYNNQTIKVAFYGESTVSNADNDFHIANVVIRETPSCAKPTGVTVSNIAATQADINITGGNAWTIKYINTGNTNTNDTVTVNNVTSITHTLTGLSPNTSYQVKVQTNCGTDGNSEWTNEVQFRTACAAISTISTISYTCGFESTEIDSENVPWCWEKKNDADNGYDSYPSSTSSYARTGSRSLMYYFSSSYNYGSYQIAVLPQIDVSANPMSTLRLVFYARTGSSAYGGDIYVGVMSNPDDVSTWTPVETLSVTNQTAFQKYKVDFNNYTGSAQYMAIRVPEPTSASYKYIYIDDVTISTIPDCDYLTGDGVTVSEIKNTSVKLTVTDNTADGSWSYAYDDQGLDVASLPFHDVTTPGTVTLSGLSPETDYVIYARRKCNSEYGECSEGVYFRTACNPTTVPFSDDFESTSTGLLVGCYNVTSTGTSSSKLYVMSGSSYSANGGSKGICSSSYGSSSSYTSNTYTVTRLVTLESGKNYKISVYAKADYNSSYYWNLGFVYGSDNANLTPYETKSVNSTSFSEYSSTFNVLTGGDYYVGIRLSGSGYYAHFDDISITEVDCVQPTGVTASNITTDAATITWTGGVGSTSYDLKYKLSSASDDEANWTEYTGVTSPYNLTGLSANTSYDVKVKAYCSGTPTDYTDAVSFRTACALPYSESFNVSSIPSIWSRGTGLVDDVTAGTASVTSTTSGWNTTSSTSGLPASHIKTEIYGDYTKYWLISPSVVVTSSQTSVDLSFDMAFTASYSSSAADPDGDDDRFVVLYSTDNGATWVNYREWNNSGSSYVLNDVATNGESVVMTLPSTCAGHTIKVAFYVESTEYNVGNDFHIANVVLQVTPSCFKPTGLAVNGTTLTSTTADLTWTAGGTEDTWNLQYKLSSDDSWTSVNGLTSTSYQLTNLTGGKSYDVQVQADCGGGDESEWSSTLTFTTACPAYFDMPFSEDFNSLTSGIPACWDNTDGTTSYENFKWNYYATGNTGACVRFNSYSNSNGKTNMLKTPVIRLTAVPAILTFAYKNPNGGDFSVYISTDGGSTYSTALLTGLTSQSTWTTAEVPLNDYKNNNVVIVFQGTSNYGSYDAYIYLDDVSITENVNTFTGDEDNDWTVSDNWSKGTVPTAGQAVIINANCSIPDAADAVCDAMTINYPLYVAPTASLVAASIDNTNAANLVIGSDEDGTGTVKFTSGTAPKATVEMYFKGHATWYASENAWRDPQWEYRGFIGTPDPTQTLSYIKVFKWNETKNGSNCWEDFAENSSANYTAKTGYSMANYNCSTAVTRTYTTTLTAVGDITYTGLTKTETGTGSSTSNNCGVNLITNSMSAPIDLSVAGFDLDDLSEQTFYFFRTRSYNDWKSNPDAAIVTYPYNTGSAIVSSMVPAGQSFVVKAASNNVSITIPAAAISSNESGPMYAPAENSEFGILAITAESEDGVDELYLLESNLCDEKFNNGYDGTKMFASNAPQIYASNDYGMTAVNADKTLLGQYIGVRQGSTSNSITLTISRRGLENYSDLKLYDCLSDTYYDLDDDETTITVTATGDQPRRFLISGKRDDGTEYTPTESGKFVIAGDQLMLENFGRTDAQIMLTDASGKILWSESSRNGTTFTLPQLPAGVYFISCGKVSTKYITK